LTTSRRHLVLLLVCVYVPTTGFGSETTSSAEGSSSLGSAAISSRIEQPLPPLNQFSFLPQLVLLLLCLPPVFVGDSRHDPTIGFGPGFLLFLCFLLLPDQLLLDLLLSLSDERPLQPLLKFHVADLLPVLLFEAFALILLQFEELVVLQVHSLAAFPLGHLMRSLLHPNRLLLLLLYKRFEEISLGLSYQFGPQLQLVLLASDPLGMRLLLGLGLKS
jgi:hypothetical protein